MILLCRRDLAELHKCIAAKDSKVQETQLSAEMNAKEELRFALERSQQEARRDHDALLLQVSSAGTQGPVSE